MRIRMEINEIENIQTIEKINKIKRWFFEKINEVDIASLTKKNRILSELKLQPKYPSSGEWINTF